MQIYYLAFDLDEMLHRHVDIRGAWNNGLMTGHEARVLAELLFEDVLADKVLAEAMEMKIDDIHRMWISGARVPGRLAVALSRLATNIDVLNRFGAKHRELMMRVKKTEENFEADREAAYEIYTEIVEIVRQPTGSLDVAQDPKAFGLLMNDLTKRIARIVVLLDYDQTLFEVAIEDAQLRVRGHGTERSH